MQSAASADEDASSPLWLVMTVVAVRFYQQISIVHRNISIPKGIFIKLKIVFKNIKTNKRFGVRIRITIHCHLNWRIPATRINGKLGLTLNTFRTTMLVYLPNSAHSPHRSPLNVDFINFISFKCSCLSAASCCLQMFSRY